MAVSIFGRAEEDAGYREAETHQRPSENRATFVLLEEGGKGGECR